MSEEKANHGETGERLSREFDLDLSQSCPSLQTLPYTGGNIRTDDLMEVIL